MRVLHIMSGYGGGISSFIRNKAEEMPAHQVVFDVVTYDNCADDFVAAIQATGGNVYQLVNPKRHGWRAFIRSFTQVLEVNHYDVVHCHISGYRAMVYALLCRRYKMKSFHIHAHFTLDPNKTSWRTRFDQWVNRRFSATKMGCSDEAIRSIYGWQTPTESFMVIPNSIDVERYRYTQEQYQQLRAQVREHYGIAEDTQLIGQIGRLTPIKNHALTLQLATLAKERHANQQFLIVGAGELESELKAQVVEWNLEAYVQFAGRVEPISELYPALDGLVLPSFREGLPTVVVESQAAGVPVVMSESITDEVDLGLNLVVKDNIEQLNSWYEHVSQLQSLGTAQAAQRFARIEQQKFSNEASAQLYADWLTGKVKHYRIVGGGDV